MSRVIALFNQSGGVGKSTLTMNLGYHLAQRKHRVLLVDMDPQGSLTLFMGLEPLDLEKTIYNSLIEGISLPIHYDLHGMSLAPTNIHLCSAEMELFMAEMRELRLREVLKPVRKQYDFILVDCPPSLGLLSFIALVASTHVLVPVQTQYKSFVGTELLLDTVIKVKSRINRSLKIAGFVPMMYSARNSQDVRSLQAIQEQMVEYGHVFEPLPRATVFSDASEKHVPLELYSPKHPALVVLQQVAEYMETL